MHESPLRTLRPGFVIQELTFPSIALLHFSRNRFATCRAKIRRHRHNMALGFVYAHCFYIFILLSGVFRGVCH